MNLGDAFLLLAAAAPTLIIFAALEAWAEDRKAGGAR